MVATFNGNPSATIISCYRPTNVSEETELIAFYDELSSLIRSIPKHNVHVISGDMNDQIWKNGNHKFSLYNSSNRNGQHLRDFKIENILTCINTNFQKSEGKLWTNTYANNTKAQFDYVFINKKWNNCALNCEAYSSFEGVSSDHRIVMAKIGLSPRKNATRTMTTVHYDWSQLNNRDIRDKYVIALRKKFDALQEKRKQILRMMNMRISSSPTNKHQRNTYQLKKELNLESHGRHWRLEKSMQTWKLPPNAIGGTQPIQMPWNLKRHKMN